MFFAPPKVKSLSRYAEYGTYLNTRHFLVMLGIAITLHIGIIAIYSMVPSVEIVKIPVRVLNIKLTGGNAGGGSMDAPSMAPLPSAQAPSEEHELTPTTDVEAEDIKPMPEAKPDKVIDKALTKDHAKPSHAAHGGKEAHKGSHAGTSDLSLATPKKYVREGDAGAGKGRSKTGSGNGSDIAGDAGGTEVMERYTQKISQWVKNHQMIARERCMQAKIATGECDAKGSVIVRIRIDRDGNILYKGTDKSSGKDLVNQLALQIVAASEPFPAVPSDYPSDKQLEFLIPVQVDLTARH